MHGAEEIPGADHRLQPPACRGWELPLADFYAARLAEKRVSDLISFRIREGWVYLTGILDLADRKVVGCALGGDDHRYGLADGGEKQAPEWEFSSSTLTGVQYACSAFREQLEGMPVLQNRIRKGDFWDNAVAESFFKTMKTEMAYHRSFATR